MMVKTYSARTQDFGVYCIYMCKSLINPHIDYLVGLSLIFCLSIHLHPSFRYVSSKGSGFDTMHLGQSGIY